MMRDATAGLTFNAPLLHFPIQLAAELEDPLLLEALLLFEGSHLFELLIVVIN